MNNDLPARPGSGLADLSTSALAVPHRVRQIAVDRVRSSLVP